MTAPADQVTDPHKPWFAVVSDTHLTADPASAATLRQALARVAAGARPAALLLPGDLAASGAPEAYAELRRQLEPVEVPVVPVMGNHDELGAFTAAFGAPDRVVRIGGTRIVALDSTIPGHHHGRLEPDQLEWLAAELATPAPEGTVLVLSLIHI